MQRPDIVFGNFSKRINMPRKPRFGLTEVPQHVIQRGNNRNACFFTDDDYRFYLRKMGSEPISEKIFYE
jgi:REP element-mobilizing transposase RayT